MLDGLKTFPGIQVKPKAIMAKDCSVSQPWYWPTLVKIVFNERIIFVGCGGPT